MLELAEAAINNIDRKAVTNAGRRTVIRRRFVHEPQKQLQRRTVFARQRDTSLRIDAFEVTDEQHAKINS